MPGIPLALRHKALWKGEEEVRCAKYGVVALV